MEREIGNPFFFFSVIYRGGCGRIVGEDLDWIGWLVDRGYWYSTVPHIWHYSLVMVFFFDCYTMYRMYDAETNTMQW